MHVQETVNDVIDFLIFSSDKVVSSGWYISSKIRKTILLEHQNKIIRNGKVLKIQWENVGSGVYRIFLNIDKSS
jgi:hypothetical protein